MTERRPFDGGFVVMGAGGHGKVVGDLLQRRGTSLAGYVDVDPAVVGESVGGLDAEVVMLQEEFLDALAGGLSAEVDGVAVAIGDSETRLELLGALPDGSAPPLVHPDATVAENARLGSGTVVFAGAVVNPGTRIGEGVIVNTGAVIEHDCDIGRGAHVSPQAAVCGEATVGERTWVGAGATVIHTVEVGSDAVVGAGAVVIGDVEKGVTVTGNPAEAI